MGISCLTLYAFSSDNWHRPAEEVEALMRLFEHYLRSELAECVRNDVRLSVIGRRDRLPPRLVGLIDSAEQRTRHGSRLLARLAIDYSARHAIVGAARRLGTAGGTVEFGREILRQMHSVEEVPDVDLLVRTGGERRLSDFLLWECAYSELFFTDCRWPDFGAAELERAVGEYRGRERRFGRVGRVSRA